MLSRSRHGTDLLTGEDAALDAGTRRVINILADRVETVAPYLVGRILANDRHVARVGWLPKRKVAWRFAKAPFNRRDLFAERDAAPKESRSRWTAAAVPGDESEEANREQGR